MISFIEEKCTGCGVCAKVCPQAVIAIIDGNAQVTDYQSCMECGACNLNCRFNAVEVTKGTGCLIAIIKEDILKIAPKNCGCATNCG